MDRNGGRSTDWALTLLEFGRFFGRRCAEPVADLPEINVCYDLPRLEATLGGLPAEFVGVAVHARLRARGHKLWHVPEAVMLDAHQGPFGHAALSQYHHGRLFGGWRMRDRRTAQRLLRLALIPGVPALLMARISRGAFAGGRGGALLRALPPLLLLLLAWSAGEAVGTLLGEGSAASRWT